MEARKKIYRILDNLSPSEGKLTNIPREADGLLNCYFNVDGQIEKRLGFSLYNTVSLGSGHAITGLHRRYKQDETKEFLCAWNVRLYKMAATTPWAGTALNYKSGNEYVVGADKQTHFVDFKDHTYITNGTQNLMKYGGTYVRSVGMTVPIAPTLTSTSNGSLTAGDYLFKVTYVDEDEYESNGGAASATMAAGVDPNDGLTIVIPVSSDPKVTKRRIYRTIADGTDYYYDGEVANNTGTAYVSTVSDATIKLKSELHTDHDNPTDAPDLVSKQRARIVTAINEEVSLSHLPSTGQEYFPVGIVFPTGNMQNVSGLAQQMLDFQILTKDSLERLTGVDEDNFEVKNSFMQEGCVATRSIVNAENMLLYLGFDGIYYYDGTTGRKLGITLSEYIYANINPAYAHLAAATYFENKYILSYPKGASTVNNETVYYDFKTRTSGVYDFGFSCFSKWNKGGDGLQLYSGSTTIGQIYRVFSGLDDAGEVIPMSDTTLPMDFGKPDIWKDYYDIYVKVKTTTATALTMYYTLDNDDEKSCTAQTLTANKTLWYRFRMGSGGNRARAIALRPYCTDKYARTIMGYGIVYSEGEPEWK